MKRSGKKTFSLVVLVFVGILGMNMLIENGRVFADEATGVQKNVNSGETGTNDSSKNNKKKNKVSNVKSSEKGKCNETFLGMRAWHYGLTKTENCSILSPKDIDLDDSSALSRFVWQIILNIGYDINFIIGFVMIFVISYGGFLQIISRGEPGKVVAGKKTMVNGVIGLLIILLAGIIINTISNVLKIG